MPVTIVSTTDTPQEIQAALGQKVEPKVVEEKENKSAPAPEASETVEASDAHGETEDLEADSTDESEEASEAPKKKNGFKKRIDKLNKRVSAKESEVEYWRNEALKNQKPMVQENKSADNKVDLSKKPNADSFNSHDEYIEALTDWKTDQKFAAREAKQREDSLRSDADKQRTTYFERAKEFAKTKEDWKEALEEVDDVIMSLTVQEILLTSENGPELSYELAKNKEEYKRICALSPIAAAREMGRFEAGLTPKDYLEKIQTKSKPKPISPIGAKAAQAKNPDDMTFKEFEKWREQTRKKA